MNPLKIAAAAVALVATTGAVTGVTTAYLLRPAAPSGAVPDVRPAGLAPLAPTVLPAGSARVAAPPTAPRAVTHEPVAVTPAVHHPSPAAHPAPAAPTHVPPAPAVTTTPAPPVVAPTATTPVAADCATTGDRVWRIAKPGLLGGMLGAGLGAAGGAIADGGSGAGKGAMIGGLVGAAAGAAYGAYDTKQACGTVLGPSGSGFTGGTPAGTPRPVITAASEAPVQPRTGASGIRVHNVR